MAESVKATLRDWFLVTRPWSVTAPLVPFLVGAALAHGEGVEPGGWWRWSLALASGILLVLACNLFNTWGDERSGVDRVPGAVLTTPQIQAGKFTLWQIFIYGSVLLILAAALGFPTLFYRGDGGWRFNVPLLIGSAVGFLGAVNYSTGIKYKYLGLGVPAVALLEGVLYVLVVMALMLPAAWVRVWSFGSFGFFLLYWIGMSLPVASLVGVILHGNDMRDLATDRRAGIRSIAMMLGPKWSLALFFALHLLPQLFVVALAVVSGYRSEASEVWTVAGCARWLPLLALPPAVRLLARAVRDYREAPSAPKWLDLEQGSGKIHFLFGVLYASSLALAY